jgi:hypothetical protein
MIFLVVRVDGSAHLVATSVDAFKSLVPPPGWPISAVMMFMTGVAVPQHRPAS